MPAMLDPSSGKEHWQTLVTMRVGIAHATANDDHRIIEHPGSGEPIEKDPELLKKMPLQQNLWVENGSGSLPIV
jgi:hypothetical protein